MDDPNNSDDASCTPDGSSDPASPALVQAVVQTPTLIQAPTSESGFWIEGEIFREQAVSELWHHWHLTRPDPGLALALQHQWIEVSDGAQPVWDLSPDSLLLPGMHYRVWLAGHQEGDVDAGWKLLWQDDDLLAVYKPPGLPVSRTPRNLFMTLVSLIRRQTRFEEAHLLHRIDAETSGLVLIAADSHADRKWKKRMDKLVTHKRYIALVEGDLFSGSKQTGWDDECWLAEHPDSEIRRRVHVVDQAEIEKLISEARGSGARGSEAKHSETSDTDVPVRALLEQKGWIKPRLSQTRFQPLALFSTNSVSQSAAAPNALGGNENNEHEVREHAAGLRTLVACQLLTGRRHQLRTRLASLGHPIVGDKLYGHDGHYYLKRLENDGLTAEDYQTLGAAYQLLHAIELRISRFGSSQVIRSDQYLPGDWPEDVRAWVAENWGCLPFDEPDDVFCT